MTHPTTHDLERCLAKWAGVDIINVGGGVWVYFDGADKKTWHPLTDANQMELCEGGVKVKHKIKYEWDGECWHVQLDYGVYYRNDPDKKTAFALAVWELDQQQMKGDA